MIEIDRLRERLRGRNGLNESLILYGSYARGDFDDASDVDVLRIADERAFREQLTPTVSLHTYALDDLVAMAREGSLFVLHLLNEGVVVRDARGTLPVVAREYRRPASYAETCKYRLQTAVRVLDADSSLFAQAPVEFFATSIFMCRTLVYAEHADRGAFSFSLQALASHDQTASMLLGMKRALPSYAGFRRLRETVRAQLACSWGDADISSFAELARLGTGDQLFEGLLHRVVRRLGPDPYIAPFRQPPQRTQLTSAGLGF